MIASFEITPLKLAQNWQAETAKRQYFASLEIPLRGDFYKLTSKLAAAKLAANWQKTGRAKAANIVGPPRPGDHRTPLERWQDFAIFATYELTKVVECSYGSA
jgi:hypothetical protein